MKEWIAKQIGKYQAEKEAKKGAKLSPEEREKQRQKDFANDYKAMTNSFSDQKAGDSIKSCSLSKTKAQRRKERINKIKKANEKASKMPEGIEKKKITDASNRLMRDMDEVEYAKAAKHVYLKYGDQSEMPSELKSKARSFG